MTELLKPEEKRKEESSRLSPSQELDGLDTDEDYSSEYEQEEDEEDEDEDESDEGYPDAMSFDMDEDEDNAVAERENYEEVLRTNRLMLVDEQGFPQLVQSLRDGFKLYSTNYLFRDNKKQGSEPAAPATGEPSSSSDACGVNLGIGETENELGWLAFQYGELVGFVYDGTGCGLQMTKMVKTVMRVKIVRMVKKGKKLKLGKTVKLSVAGPPNGFADNSSF